MTVDVLTSTGYLSIRISDLSKSDIKHQRILEDCRKTLTDFAGRARIVNRDGKQIAVVIDINDDD